jgi:hypothetical protein
MTLKRPVSRLRQGPIHRLPLMGQWPKKVGSRSIRGERAEEAATERWREFVERTAYSASTGF